MSTPGRPQRNKVWTRLNPAELEFVLRIGHTAGMNHTSECLRYCVQLLKTLVDGEMIYMPKEAAEVLLNGRRR